MKKTPIPYLHIGSMIAAILLGGLSLLSQNPSFSITGKMEITTPYAQQNDFNKWYFDSTSYELARQTSKYECLKISYPSAGVPVEAWIYKPLRLPEESLPVIIYNRGGMGNFGDLTECDLVNFYQMAEAGYLVLASRYRFVGEMGKFDQHGGIDVQDVINLKAVIQSLPYADTANIFMYGFSRGGQMCYQASKYMKVNAMATVAGTADWTFRYLDRPEFVNGWQDKDSPETDYLGFRNVIPNWAKDSVKIIQQRSAVFWADSIQVPVLIMHSRLDPRVEVEHSLKLATQLQQYQKEYALIIYNEPSHSLPFKHFDSYHRMFAWFQSHSVPRNK